MSWRIEQLAPDRADAIARLIGEIEQRPMSGAFWRRKYAHAGDAGPGIAVMFHEGDRAIASAGALLYRLRGPGGESWTGAQLCDFIIRPEARRQKRFRPLGEALIALLRAQGCDLLFGFANPKSEGFVREQLGFQTVGRMDCYEMPVGGSPAMARLRRRSLGALRQRMLAGDPPAMAMPAGGWGCEHGPTFHAARLATGARTVRLAGLNLLVHPGQTLTVGAVDPGDDAAIDRLLAELAPLARSLGSERVRFMVQRDTGFDAQLAARLGPSPGGWYIIAQDLAGNGMPLDRLRFWFADYEGF